MEQLNELIKISARLGSDTKHIQGPGGNTSMKLAGVLWMKASGTWLAKAREENIFVPLDLATLRDAIAAGAADPAGQAARLDIVPHSRPASIEVSLHALLHHRIVLHTHSVSVLAVVVRRDAQEILEECMAGLSWALVPYARPGLPLATAIVNARTNGSTNILFLANHGLVVGADDFEPALELIANIESRLATAGRTPPKPNFEALYKIAKGSEFSIAEQKFHQIATDEISLRIATEGSLYPDHVVFLGPGIVTLQTDAALSALSVTTRTPLVVAVPGAGVLLHQSINAAARSMVGCLADVLPHIPDNASINYLSQAQEHELINWDAEKLRQLLNT
jgi:rhamnose utilization protein RhaD (predicted bifunctional aldolase and dehydrogenase)